MNVLEKIEELRRLQETKFIPNRINTIATLRNEILKESGIIEKQILQVGDYVLTYHPKLKTKRHPDGLVTIYTKESYNRMSKGTESYGEMKHRIVDPGYE